MSGEEPYLNPKVVADFVDMMEAELEQLRAWKEKARPFLLLARQAMEGEIKQFTHLDCVEVRIQSLYELTELLKEGE